MLHEILTPAQEALLTEERALLGDLDRALARRGADGDRSRLEAAAEGLEPLFLVVLVGRTGAATERLAEVLGGPDAARGPASAEVVAASAEDGPDPWSGRADLALVLTVARHPLAGAERDLLAAAAAGAERVVVAIDEVDMLRLSEDVDRMEEAVEAEAERLLGRPVPAFGIATAQLEAALGAGAPRAPASGSLVPALARQVVALLRAPVIVHPKLRTPAEVGRALAAEHLRGVGEELAARAPELEALSVVETHLAAFDRSVEEALRRSLDEAKRRVEELSAAGEQFVRRATRPFPVPFGARARLRGRFDRGPAGAARERLETVAVELEREIETAAEREAGEVAAWLEGHPAPRETPDRDRGHGRSSAAEGEAGDCEPAGSPVPGRQALEAFRDLVGTGPEGAHAAALSGSKAGSDGAGAPGTRGLGDALIERLGGTWAMAFALLVAGLLFALTPVAWSALVAETAGPGEAAGPGLWTIVLGAGLGGAAILAAIGLLGQHRRRLLGLVERRIAHLEVASAEALTALAETWRRRGADRVRAPGGPWLQELADERERLLWLQQELDRLRQGFQRLLDRLD